MAIPFNLDWLKGQQKAAKEKAQREGKPERHILPPYDAERLRKEQWDRIFNPAPPTSDKS